MDQYENKNVPILIKNRSILIKNGHILIKKWTNFNQLLKLAINRNLVLLSETESNPNRMTMTKSDFELDIPIQFVSPNCQSL